MICPLRSKTWTACAIDCKIFKYCFSVNFPPPPDLPSSSSPPPPRLSLRSGEAWRNDAVPLFLHLGAPAPSPPLFLLRCGDIECERCCCCCLTSAAETLSLDISRLRCSWLSSSSRIFLRSSSAGGVSILGTEIESEVKERERELNRRRWWWITARWFVCYLFYFFICLIAYYAFSDITLLLKNKNIIWIYGGCFSISGVINDQFRIDLSLAAFLFISEKTKWRKIPD